jgi:hypothetical protein
VRERVIFFNKDENYLNKKKRREDKEIGRGKIDIFKENLYV